MKGTDLGSEGERLLIDAAHPKSAHFPPTYLFPPHWLFFFFFPLTHIPLSTHLNYFDVGMRKKNAAFPTLYYHDQILNWATWTERKKFEPKRLKQAPAISPLGFAQVGLIRQTDGYSVSNRCGTMLYRVFIKYCVFFWFYKNIPDSVFPRYQCVYTHQAGRKPALQQNRQSSEKS